MTTDDELLNIMNIMVGIIDQLYELPKECPEVKKSKTYIDMTNKTEALKKYMEKRTQEMNNLADKVGLSVLMGRINNKNNNN